MGVNGRANGNGPNAAPKRGIVWFVVFVVVFAGASYLLRMGDKQKPLPPDDSLADTEQVDEQGDESDRWITDGDTPSDLDSLPSLIDLTPSNDESEAAESPATSETTEPVSSTSARGPPVAEDSPYAPLREIRPDVWESPAGLLYKPGSAEGHRIKHLERHFEDDPGRPIHGVFAGNFSEVIEQIDQAFRWSEEGNRRATVRQDRGRTIVIARFDEAIGFVGGERGADDGHPEVFRVQVVLEDNDVITAYPVE